MLGLNPRVSSVNEILNENFQALSLWKRLTGAGSNDIRAHTRTHFE